MSRIHEALKKAEQERAAVQGGEASGYASAVAPEMPPAMRENSERATAAVAPTPTLSAAGPSFNSAFSFDALLARVPQLDWQPDDKAMLFFNGNESGRGTEEFRTLRSRLYHLRENMTLKKILVTSALPKEGKSFTSANLAQVLVRQHGRRVLLIDADLRAPRLHLMLGTSAAPGLAEYLQGACDEFSIVQRGPMENLFFIPSGNQISDAAEMVANGKLKILLQRLESLFDWIIVDSPPAVPVSDASVLAKACDGVVMVVRSNATPIDMARRAREEFPDQALVGVVLNGTNSETTPYSRYYYDAYVKNVPPESKV
jgi:capsular exopolysaccharide synthesis family protein